MTKYLDSNGLLYLLQYLLTQNGNMEISPVIDDSSTHDTAASSKAVHDYVIAALSAASGMSVMIVETLPAVGQNNIIYLIANANDVSGDSYSEYMWINSAWEIIGTTNVDLTGYIKESDLASWAKAEQKPSYTASEVGAAAQTHTHTVSDITDLEPLTNSEIDGIIALCGGNGSAGESSDIRVYANDERNENLVVEISGGSVSISIFPAPYTDFDELPVNSTYIDVVSMSALGNDEYYLSTFAEFMKNDEGVRTPTGVSPEYSGTVSSDTAVINFRDESSGEFVSVTYTRI